MWIAEYSNTNGAFQNQEGHCRTNLVEYKVDFLRQPPAAAGGERLPDICHSLLSLRHVPMFYYILDILAEDWLPE
jgi:hypothetical protein